MKDKLKTIGKISLIVILIALTILMASQSVQAQKYFFDEPNTVLSIPKCDGPIKVRISSYRRLADGEITIPTCTKLSNYVWTCECAGRKEVRFQVSSNYSNAYNFDILYYLNYWEIPGRVVDINGSFMDRNPTEEEIRLETYSRQIQVKGIILREPKNLFNIQFNMTIGSIVLACIIVMIGASMFAFSKFKKKLNSNNDIDLGGDMFNYSNLENNDALDKIVDNMEQKNTDADQTLLNLEKDNNTPFEDIESVENNNLYK